MNLSVLQLFGAESTKVIKKQLYTNNMSCKQKKDCSSKRNSLFSKPSIKKAIVPGFYSIPFDPDFVSDSS